MTYVTAVFISILVLFIVFLLLKSVVSIKACALCGAVVVTWITLLIFFYKGLFTDTLIIGILMGGSVVGILYMLKAKLHEDYTLFILPFFLTGVLVVYTLLTREVVYDAVTTVGLVWVPFIGLFMWRNGEYVTVVTRKLIECCKNW